MIEADKRAFKEMVEATMGLYQTEISTDVLKLWWGALQNFTLETVRQAFSRHVQDGKQGRFAPKPADIIGIIGEMNPDGRPGADEAWSLYPHDESSSAVINNEIAEAMNIAQPLVDAGDMIGARMAFKDAYNRITSQNKFRGEVPRWFPSLGTDPQGREVAIKDAVQRGRLTQSHAEGLLPPPNAEQTVAMLGDLKMLTQKADLTDEEKERNRERIQAIKAKFFGKAA